MARFRLLILTLLCAILSLSHLLADEPGKKSKEPEKKPDRSISLIVKQIVRIKLDKVKEPAEINNSAESVGHVGPGTPGGNEFIMVGLTPGKTIVEVTGEDKSHETIEFVVRRGQLTFPEDVFEVQSSKKMAVKSFTCSDEKIAIVKRGDGKDRLQVEVRTKGEAVITLTQDDGKTEEFVISSAPVDMLVKQGETVAVHMSKKQNISVAMVQPGSLQYFIAEEPKHTFKIDAEVSGIMTIELIDEKGNVEVRRIGVKPKK
jgi:hypothetical protein